MTDITVTMTRDGQVRTEVSPIGSYDLAAEDALTLASLYLSVLGCTRLQNNPDGTWTASR
jgi:hypothetical protein